MKNIDRLVQHMTLRGAENIMVHTVYGTVNWIIAQKIEPDKWLITLGNPMGNVTYNLGTVTNEQHLQLWYDLTTMEIEKRTTQALIARELKNKIHNFIKRYVKSKTNKIKKHKRLK